MSLLVFNPSLCHFAAISSSLKMLEINFFPQAPTGDYFVLLLGNP